MRAVKDRPVTYQDVLDAPDGMRAEILDGELVMQARPMPEHDHVDSVLRTLLTAAFQLGGGGPGAPGGWWIMREPELHFGDPNFRTVDPDLAGWRKERMPVIERRKRYDVVPDWVCEILLPSTARSDRMKKMPIYADVGVKDLWLADPANRSLETYTLENGRWVLLATYGEEGEIAIPPFGAVSLPLAELWLPEEDAPST